MRILIVHNFYAQPGGEDAVVRAESAALRARGHEVFVSSLDSAELFGHPLRAVAETLTVVHNPLAYAKLQHNLASFRPDIVHLHNLFPRWGTAALRCVGRAGVPTVQTLHNFRYLCAPATLLRDGRDCRLCARGDFTGAVRYACMRQSRVVSAAYAVALAQSRRAKLAATAVARFICVSDFVRTVHADVGFAPERLTVKGHFVAAAPGPDGPGDQTVIYAGRLSPEKGVQILLDALRLLPGVVLCIAGDGPERPALERTLGPLAPQVRFLGRLPHAALISALQRASVVAVPSVGSETFGLAALEAFACGRPVVATDAGGLPELVRDGETGWTVPRGDPSALAARIRWLLDRPAQARAFGQRGQELVMRQHLLSPNLDRLEAIYDDAIRFTRSGLTVLQAVDPPMPARRV